MRLVAASGIVIFHAQAPGHEIGLSGLSFFAILIPWFILTSERPNCSLRDLINDRGKRLLVPWLGWSVLYAGLKLADAAFTGSPLAEEFRPWMLLTGPALHLWFLPFAFLTTVIISFVAPHALAPFAHLPRLRTSVALACAGLSVISTQAITPTIEPPFLQYTSVAPALLMGISLGFVGSVRWQMAICFALASSVLLIGPQDSRLQLAIASVALCLCAAYPVQSSELSDLAANLSLTVYLAHPIVLSALERGFDLDRQTHQLGVLGLIITIVFAMLWDLAKTWLSRRRALAKNSG